MRIVRDRRDARWLPSRFHFALFRLFAYLRLRRAKPESAPGLVMIVDRYQSAAENYLVAICIFVVATSFVVTLLNLTISLPAAWVIAVPVTAIMIQISVPFLAVVIMPMVRKIIPLRADNLALNSAVLMAIAIGAAVFVVIRGSATRYLAAVFLFFVALNAIAAGLMFVLRGSVAEAERRLGVEP